jgi:hypothetical protein
VACLGAILAALSPVSAQELRSKQDVDERAALRAAARARIVEELERRLVRPTRAEVISADADRLTGSLSDERLRAVAGGDDEAVSTALSEMRLATRSALGDATSDLVFVPLPPCRILDTRQGSGGILVPGEVRSFQVAGNTEFGPQGGTLGGCGVPPGGAEPVAAAVMLNLIAVDAQGRGNMLAWAYGEPQPFASSINYQALNQPMNVANGLIVPIAGTNLVPADMNLRVQFSPSHAIADVTGYFTRFPIEQFTDTEKSITVVSELGQVDLSSLPANTCAQVNSCTITSGSAGKVIVRVWAQVKIDHGSNIGGDRIAVGIKNVDPTNCTTDQSINVIDFEVSDGLPADGDVDWTLFHKRIFTHNKGTRTYYINARMITGGGAGDFIQNSRMICTFIPNPT